MTEASKPPAGFSADTEILTRFQGWVRFDRLTAFDEVATRTPDREFRWEHPERIIWQPYSGDMVWFHGRTTDMMVAPAQRMLYLERKRDCRGGKRIELPKVECVRRAHEFIGAPRSLVATSRWEPRNPKREIIFTAKPVRSDGRRNVGKPPLEFVASSSDFAAFMGMYLSEGSLGTATGPGNYPISVWQTLMGKGIHIYRDRLETLIGRKVTWYATKGEFRFGNKALYEYLKTLGGYAWTKRIPSEILELDAEDLETFWYYYWLGDGSMMSSQGRKDIEVMQTTSKVMADSLQEILQKLGGWSKVHEVVRPKSDGHVNGRAIKARHTLYRVVRRAGTVAFPTRVQKMPYAGMVGSVSVSAPAIYVRRNDHPVWAASA